MTGVRSVVLCDDIRREISGKDILIGAYAGSIVVAQWPFALNIAMWIEYEPAAIGNADIHLQFSYAGKAPSKVKISAQFLDLSVIGIPLTGMAVIGDEEGELKIETSTDGSNWQTLKTYSVRKGKVTSLPTAINTPSPSSS